MWQHEKLRNITIKVGLVVCQVDERGFIRVPDGISDSDKDRLWRKLDAVPGYNQVAVEAEDKQAELDRQAEAKKAKRSAAAKKAAATRARNKAKAKPKPKPKPKPG